MRRIYAKPIFAIRGKLANVAAVALPVSPTTIAAIKTPPSDDVTVA